MQNYEKLDFIGSGIKRKHPIPFYDYIGVYLKRMRRVEKYSTSQNMLGKIRYSFNKILLRNISVKTGIQVPPNTFKGGLTIYHWGSIIVNETVRGGGILSLCNQM